jgi:hypothetical protein
VAQIDDVKYVGIDVKLNRGERIKFQPDIVGFRKDLSHVVYVDFESPNSCDSRLPEKDIKQYLRWVSDGSVTPYIVITSLPDQSAPRWALRYASDLNAEHRNSRTEMRANPLSYWSSVWRRDLAGVDLSRVTLLNINGRSVRNIEIFSQPCEAPRGNVLLPDDDPKRRRVKANTLMRRRPRGAPR